MLKTDERSKKEYLYRTYASFLGKCIGVRLGAPVENWSHEDIINRYPLCDSYPVDYDIFAADDDTNGPLFFSRAIDDYDEISAENIGSTFLNYLGEHQGFFWWGGYGVSSEHTAYDNLMEGIKAPLSGSYKTNGRMIAEQIGGQIFSDCWGYVSGYDPELAKQLAIKASSVTHDLNGIQGGIFVAVAICLAYQMNDIYEVIDRTLEYLDPEMEYYKVAKDIIRFHHGEPEDDRICLAYIHEHYGYDRYPGTCHIIPNMALMMMAMLYGSNDFDKTMIMLNEAGWDTDCNCGNVGSIMGALLGLEGIGRKWIDPINDIVNCSSAIGCLNIQSISDAAMMFTKMAYRLKGLSIDDSDMFELPYATKGIRCNEGKIECTDSHLHVSSPDIYKYVYYLKDDIYDARYDPQFSPIIEPGDEISLDIHSDQPLKLSLYVIDCEGRYHHENHLTDADQTIIWKIPSYANMVINKAGIKADGDYFIKDIRIKRKAKLEYLFDRDYPIDRLGPRYEKDYMNNIRAFVKHSGDWNIEDHLVGRSVEHGLISTGNYGNEYRCIEWRFIPEKGRKHLLVFNMKGYLNYWAAGIDDGRLVLIRKDVEEKMVRYHDLEFEYDREHLLKMIDNEKGLSVFVDDEEYLFDKMKLTDLIGIYLGEDCINTTLSIKTYI